MNSLRTGVVASALVASSASAPTVYAANFGEDVAFLRKHTPLLMLSDRAGIAKVAVSPAWQGRVMTSTAQGDNGMSFGWINRELIASGQIQPHINVFGGEDRFWLGPEGGQFSIFFGKGAPFELKDWFTPAAIDTMPYDVVKQSKSSVMFRAAFAVTNYSGTRFDVGVNREVKLLTATSASSKWGVKAAKDLQVVAYETINKITNAGKLPWEKNRPAFGLDTRDVQSLPRHDDCGSDQGRIGIGIGCEGNVRLFRKHPGGSIGGERQRNILKCRRPLSKQDRHQPAT